MSGALNSGMDLLIELSAGFIRRVVRKKLQDMDEGCFDAPGVSVPDPRDPDGTPLVVDLRRIQLDVESLSFQQTLGGPVQIVADVALLYAQALWIDNSWKSLDELEVILGAPISRAITTTLTLNIAADPTNIQLSVDISTLPFVPEEMGDPVSLPITFLDQVEEWVDEAGAAQTATLLALTINGQPVAKVLNANTLVIGLDVELSQDANIMIPGPGVPRTNPIVASADDLVPHSCGLPDQPGVDRPTFTTDFVDSFGQGNDWAVALDGHVLDAILRGAPSAGVNNVGEERGDCEHEDSVLYNCMRLHPPLEEDLIKIAGGGLAYLCSPEFIFDNGYYVISYRADVTLSIEGNWVRAHYDVTDASLDAIGSDATDALLWILGRTIEQADDVNAFRARFGDRSDPAGRLTAETLKIRTDGVVLRGSSSLEPGHRAIAVRDELLFARGCEAEGEQPARNLRIRNTGAVNLHLCPLGIRRHPDGAEHDPQLFSVSAPPELLDNGVGLTLEPGESVVVTIECSGVAGGAYVAWLDVPNDAAVKSVRLDANFQPATLGPIVPELNFAVDYAWSGCNRPGTKSVAADVELTNEGPGNLQLCAIQFSNDITEVFEATNPGIFAPGVANLRVTFAAPWGLDLDYDGNLRIRTNGGERREIHIVASTTTEQDPFGVFHHAGFDRDFACGDPDWDRVQDTGGEILDSQTVSELLPILGGEPCCPPPRGPACMCVDLWETTFFDVPFGVGLEVVDSAGHAITSSLPTSSVQTLLVPVREQDAYALRASLPAGFATTQVSRMNTRRWIVQQDGVYLSAQRITDLTASGDFAYLAGRRGLEVIRLNNPQSPERIRLMRSLAGAAGVATLDRHLLVLMDRVLVYSLADPSRPRYAGRVRTRSRIRKLLPGDSLSSQLAYGLGKRLHVLDFADLGRPAELNSWPLRARAVGGARRGELVYVFFSNGLEVFSTPDGHAPESIGFHSSAGEVRNGFVFGKSAIAVKAAGHIDIIDVSSRSAPRLASQLRMEEWMSEVVPLAGALPRSRNRLLALTPDQRGFRVLRIRTNKVDQEKLRSWRASRMSQRTA